MQAGRLRHIIYLFSPLTTGQNGMGEDIVIWQDVANGAAFSCTVEYMQGRELELFMQRWARAQYKITLRHQPGIKPLPNWRATWGDIQLDIISVQDPEGSMRPELILYCQDFEGATSGVNP